MVVPPPPTRTLLQSARTRGGLGLIPTRIGGAGAIWRHRLPEQELQRRLADIHRPYHAAVHDALRQARARFGVAILLDCHSMPPRPDGTGPKVVFGDRHGTSISGELLAAAVAAAEAAGYQVGLNVPYAGGHITERHGRPDAGIHAVQIELDRSIYLDGQLRSAGAGFDAASRMVADVVTALAAKALAPPHAIAAE